MALDSTQNDDLASLMSRNLNLSPIKEHPQTSQPITYITQHYHHSTHIAAPRVVEQEKQPLSALEVHTILLRHGVQPSVLSGDQISLFRTVDENERIRLLELWHVQSSSPRAAAIAQSEKTRMIEESRPTDVQDQTPLLCEMQQPQAYHSFYPQQPQPPNPAAAEPYIISGYEELARREYEEQARHLDPVYNGPDMWQSKAFGEIDNGYGGQYDQMHPGTTAHYIGVHGSEDSMMT